MSYAQEAPGPANRLQTVPSSFSSQLNGQPSKRFARAALPLLLLIAFFHNSLYALFLPPWGLIDEAQHLHYIQIIAEEQTLPVAGDLYLSDEIIESLFATRRWQTFHWTPPPAPDAAVMGLEGHSYEAYQPPLFYLAMAPLYQALPQDILVKVYALRMVVVLLSLITVWALYRTVGTLLPHSPHLPFLAGLLLVAMPERAFATSRINNDLLLEITAALFFLVLTRTALTGITPRRGLLLGLLVGLAVWSKIPGALLGIPLLLCLWLRRQDVDWKRGAAWALIIVPFGLGMAARNLWLYGDLTGFAAFDQLHRLAPVDPTLAGLVRALTSLPNHLWLVWWKGSDAGSNPLVTLFYIAMAGVVAASWGRLWLYFQRQPEQRELYTTRAVARIYLITLLLYALAVLSSYYQGMVPVIQGRFLLPAILPFVILVAWGLWLYPRGEKLILATVVLLWGMGLFALFGNLVPYFYYWSDVVQGSITPAQTTGLWQTITYTYQRALQDKPPFLAPLLIAMPLAYAGLLLTAFVNALVAIRPPRRWFPTAIARPRTLVGSTLQLESLARYLLPISILYLALPHLIFFIGWLQWPWAILASGAIAVALVMVTRTVTRWIPQEANAAPPRVTLPDDALLVPAASVPLDAPSNFRFTRHHAWMIVWVSLVWLVLAGIGGILRQDYDWDKHNVMLNSLILKPWPTVYTIYHEKLPLVYYIGYYLPPALIGKALGWIGANAALFLWSLTGLLLSAAWFSVLVRRVSYSALLIFVFFSGMDVIGTQLGLLGGIWPNGREPWQHIESWVRVWQYSANTTLLFWVPHHALSGWVLTGLVAYCLIILRRRDFILLPVGLSAFWSPFVIVGIIPYLVIDFLADKTPLWTRIRHMISMPNAVGLLALAMTGFYLSARTVIGSPVIINNTFSEWSLPTFDGPIRMALLYLAIFCLLEFGLHALVIYRSGTTLSREWRWMLHITVFTLFLLPWFKYGAFNDLVMRASIPALFMLTIFVTQTIHDHRAARWSRISLVVLLVIGVVTPAIEIRRHLERMWNFPPPLIDETQAPRDFVDYFETEAFFFGQYTGSVESAFFEYAAKDPSERSTLSEDQLNEHEYILYGNKIYLMTDELHLAPQDDPTAVREIAPGEIFTMQLPLHFYGLAIRSEYKISARLVDEAEQPIWSQTEWPNGVPPIDPLDISPWLGTMTMTVPSDAAPGLYQLEMGFYDAATNAYLPAASVPDEVPLGDLVPVGTVRVVAEE